MALVGWSEILLVGEKFVRPGLRSFPEAAEAGSRVSVVFRKPAELLHTPTLTKAFLLALPQFLQSW